MNKFTFLKIYFSPFKTIIPRLYIGKTAIGTPYFLPRKWVKFTEQDAINKATEDCNNKYLVHYGKNPIDLIGEYKNYSKPVPKKIGFNFVGLGWKTKWTNIDYRHEWNPIWSFVFFGYQIALIFIPEEQSHYWECWLAYSRNTDKSKSTKERIKQAKEIFPCVWSTTENGVSKKICYWDLILKK